MRRTIVIATCCALAACGANPDAYRNENVMNASVPDAPPAPTDLQTLNQASGSGTMANGAATATSSPAPTDVPAQIIQPTTPARDGKSPEAAVATIDAYYRAINARNYGRAYRLWGDNGRASNQTPEGFAKGFVHTSSTTVATGQPSDPEGAAGSIYITVPVTVSAIDNKGNEQIFAGSYVLRRVDDVPGSTAEQRRWHIASASLKQTKGNN